MANLLTVSTRLKKNRLSNMSLDFVSLVPAGDNPEAQIVISKAAPDTDPVGGPMGQPISKDDLDPEVVAYIDGLEAEVDDLTKSVEDLTADLDEAQDALSKAEEQGLVVKSEEEQQQALLAKADPAVRALIEKQQNDLAEVRKQAEAEREARLEREYLAKAEQMPMLTEDKATLSGLLRRISDALSPEDSAAVEKILATANTQIAKSNLFGEMGLGGGETTISKSAEAAAAEIKKAEPTLTDEQALAKAYEQNPNLLAEAMTGQEG